MNGVLKCGPDFSEIAFSDFRAVPIPEVLPENETRLFRGKTLLLHLFHKLPLIVFTNELLAILELLFRLDLLRRDGFGGRVNHAVVAVIIRRLYAGGAFVNQLARPLLPFPDQQVKHGRRIALDHEPAGVRVFAV